MRKPYIRKLSLNKLTIATLSDVGLGSIKGGSNYDCYGGLRDEDNCEAATMITAGHEACPTEDLGTNCQIGTQVVRTKPHDSRCYYD